MYLALFRAKMCPECGIWPLERLKLNKNVKSGYNSILRLVLDLFSLPEGLHCLFQLGLTLFQVIKVENSFSIDYNGGLHAGGHEK